MLAAALSEQLSCVPLLADTNTGDPAKTILPGTTPLTMQGDLAWQMIEGMHRYLLRRVEEAVKDRPNLWKRDYASIQKYNDSVSGNRERFRQISGAVDKRIESPTFEVLGSVSSPGQMSHGRQYRVDAVRWPVLAPVVADFGPLNAEGLLLQPTAAPVARVVAIPDADWTPEMLVGLTPGVSPAAQFARRLAEQGCQVVIPLIINRGDTFSGIPNVRMTNETHREWIYRQAYEVGRHIIGYEVQKVLSAVDWFTHQNLTESVPVAVFGYGEGGLLALYSAALDSRIDVTVVSGYFQEREQLWNEPIYRDVWGLVLEFGDAELASLIAPRHLIIEASRGPEITEPPPITKEHVRAACPNGTLISPPLDSVQREANRARSFYSALKAEDKLQLVVSDNGQGVPGSDLVLRSFIRAIGIKGEVLRDGGPPGDTRGSSDPLPRLHRQFDEMVGFTQALIRKAPDQLLDFWAKADSSSPDRWKASTTFYRNYFWDEVLGRLPSPRGDFNARTRLVYDTPKFLGYEVVLDVCEDVIDYGILLLPKNIKPGERRPTVVCQHGVEGRPTDVADPNNDVPEQNVKIYHRFAVTLAELGFVTYAPQNPYVGGDHFRILHHMGHPLKLGIFSFILAQHEQLLDWLTSQPFVDPDRIGFYGLSYGGRTAMHVPPFLERYALSICSADFNENTWKTTNVLNAYSYMILGTYDAYYFNAANVANYGELATLMAPRPFMVERGHKDTVSIDEWVSHEYAKVRRLYDTLGIGDRTEIELFDGLHEIHGVKTFEFLRNQLRWPT
jgi:dienelactone hydrolase